MEKVEKEERKAAAKAAATTFTTNGSRPVSAVK